MSFNSVFTVYTHFAGDNYIFSMGSDQLIVTLYAQSTFPSEHYQLIGAHIVLVGVECGVDRLP